MTEPSVEEKTAAAPRSSSRGQRLWAVLLVLDSFFVITFGGTLAMKLYVSWQAPAVTSPAPRAHRPPKAVQPPAASTAPAAAPVEKAAPAKSETAKAAPAAKAKPSESPRPPRPSLLSEAPRHEKAAPQTPGGSSAASGAAKTKAVPTEFSIKAPGARSVELVGAFIVRGGRKTMVSHPDGTWTLTLYLTPNTYRYWFVVNGKKTLDPNSSQVDRGASVVTVGQ